MWKENTGWNIWAYISRKVVQSEDNLGERFI